MAVEFVGIELQLRGYEGVRSDLQDLDRLLNSFRGRKKFDAGFDEARKQVVAYKGELEKLQREQRELKEKALEAARALTSATNKAQKAYKAFGKAYENSSASNVIKQQVKEASNALDQARAKLKSNQQAVEATRDRLRDAQQAVREFGQASRTAGQTFMQAFNQISSRVAHVGSAMQSLGNAMVRLTSPFRRITTGLLMGAGYKALNVMSEGLSGSFSRADTMNKYAKLMAEYETANYTAIQSRQDLDASIQGLPIALDDAISLAQRYTLSLGDMERGTKLAIATNNAFLASMATEQQRYQGMLQMQDLLNGKDLNSREWMSLGASMGKAINEVGKEFGYTDKNIGEFRQELYAGHIATEDFLNALEKVGTGNGSLVSLAKLSAETWEGLFTNAKIAVTRMGANIVDTLNETFKDATGRTLLQQLLGIDAEGNDLQDGIKHWIDGISSSIQSWVKSHPKEIIDFFNDLKSIDWKGLAKGLAEGALEFARLIGAFAKWASNKDLSKLGRWMPRLNILGNGLLVLGGFLKGTRHIWALLGVGGKRLAGKLPKFGILDRIMALFGSKKGIEQAKEIPSIANTFKSAFKSLEGMITVAGGVIIASGTGFIATKSFKNMMSDLKEIIAITSEIDWEKGAGVVTAMGTFFAAFAGLGKFASMNMAAIGDILAGEVGVGLLTTVAAGIADLDMYFIKNVFKKFKEVTDYLNQSIDNLLKLKEIKNIGDIKDRISNVVGALQQVYSSLKVQDEEGRSLMAASSQEMKAMQDIVGGMNNVLGSVQGVNDKLLELSQAKLIRKSDAVNVGEQIGGIFEGLGEIFSSYLGTAFGDNPVEMTSGMTSTIENFNNAFAIFTGDNGLFANLRKVQNELRSIPGVQTIGSTLSNIKSWLTGEGGMFDQLRDIVTSANKITNADTVETKMSNFANAFESIRVIFKKLNQIKKVTAGYQTGDIPGIGVIRRLIGQLQVAFDSEAVNRINSQIQAFLDQVNNLLETVDTINAKDGKITIEITLKDQIIGKDKVIRDINKVQTDIQNAVDNIKSYYPKTITVAINTKAIVSGIGSASQTVASIPQQVLERYKANGGLIYRAKGGGVPFRRRGTDTVPAMLTPGEYVHNRRAVNTFGIDFMRKVNNLDMKGAMNELMRRAGHMANINRGASITNNNYNNQKVVINNSNAGAGYTFKTASRFVGAF